MSELKTYPLYIDGAKVEAEDGRSFESFNPSDGTVWARMPEASEGDVDRAVRAARRAYESGPWPAMTPTQRGKMLRGLGDLMAERGHALAAIETRDTGKLFRETKPLSEYVAEFYHYYAGLADKIEGATLPIDKPDMLTMTLREPLGVVAGVVPWNSQLFLAATKLGPALAAGNTVVLKASELGPAALLEFAILVQEADFPPGVINVVTGMGEPCGRALTSHPLVSRVAFTGGPETARHVVRNTAENFAQLSLELGGKSPVLVFEDADLDSAVNGIVAGVFGAGGQSCVAGTRLLVQEKLYDRVLERLVERAGRIKIGDPMKPDTEMGPLATQAQLDRIETVVAASLEGEAELHCGGRRPPDLGDGLGGGWYYEPTILTCRHPNVPVAEQELFGPVLSVMTFADEAEAVELANASRYGLAAGIFTRDIGRAVRVSRAVRAGIVWVNTYRAISPIAPFGGFKDSGLGRESGLEAVLDYTRPKTIWINTSTDPMADPFVMR